MAKSQAYPEQAPIRADNAQAEPEQSQPRVDPNWVSISDKLIAFPERQRGLDEGQPKVLFYSHSGDVSGAEISLLLTLQGLSNTSPLLVAPSGELLNRARMSGVPHVSLKSHRARMSKNPWVLLKGVLGTMMTGLRLRKLVKRTRPAVVHANSIRAGLIASVATFGVKIPLIWHVRDELPRNLVGRTIRFVAARQADAVFLISNAIFDNFATEPSLRERCRVVYNGINPDISGKVEDLRSVIGVQESTYVVAVVGQITPWKRQKDAIAAFAKLVCYQPDAELWIVGSPKFRQENIEYEAMLHDYARRCQVDGKVRFWGFCEDVMSIMQAIDVLLVPSENEPFGRVVIEAMLAGKPVVGTRGGGIPEIVEDGKTGFLVDIGDTTTMGNLLDWLARSQELCTEMGAIGKERALERFSINRTCAEMEETFRMVTEH